MLPGYRAAGRAGRRLSDRRSNSALAGTPAPGASRRTPLRTRAWDGPEGRAGRIATRVCVRCIAAEPLPAFPLRSSPGSEWASLPQDRNGNSRRGRPPCRPSVFPPPRPLGAHPADRSQPHPPSRGSCAPLRCVCGGDRPRLPGTSVRVGPGKSSAAPGRCGIAGRRVFSGRRPNSPSWSPFPQVPPRRCRRPPSSSVPSRPHVFTGLRGRVRW